MQLSKKTDAKASENGAIILTSPFSSTTPVYLNLSPYSLYKFFFPYFFCAINVQKNLQEKKKKKKEERRVKKLLLINVSKHIHFFTFYNCSYNLLSSSQFSPFLLSFSFFKFCFFNKKFSLKSFKHRK